MTVDEEIVGIQLKLNAIRDQAKKSGATPPPTILKEMLEMKEKIDHLKKQNKMSSLPLSLIEAYNLTNYYVLATQKFTLKVGQKSEDLIALYKKLGVNTATFITAFNPYSQTLNFEENKRRNEVLKIELEDIAWAVVEGYGQDPEGLWEKEDSFLAFGITKEEAIKLGNKFEQNAILWCDADFTPQLILLK